MVKSWPIIFGAALFLPVNLVIQTHWYTAFIIFFIMVVFAFVFCGFLNRKL